MSFFDKLEVLAQGVLTPLAIKEIHPNEIV